MKQLGEIALKVFGILLMLAALAFAVSKAPDRSLQSLVPRWAPPPSDFLDLGGQPDVGTDRTGGRHAHGPSVDCPPCAPSSATRPSTSTSAN